MRVAPKSKAIFCAFHAIDFGVQLVPFNSSAHASLAAHKGFCGGLVSGNIVFQQHHRFRFGNAHVLQVAPNANGCFIGGAFVAETGESPRAG